MSQIIVPNGFEDGQPYQRFPEIKRRIGVPIDEAPFKIGPVGKAYTSEPNGNFWDMGENIPCIDWVDWLDDTNMDIDWKTIAVNPKNFPDDFDVSHFLKHSSGNINICLPELYINDKKVDVGINGRGALGRFGPNGATDAIVTRWKRKIDNSVLYDDNDEPIMEVIMVRRKDNNELALPGGMNVSSTTCQRVSIYETAAREFLEETGGHPEHDKDEGDGKPFKTVEQLIEYGKYLAMFETIGEVVFRGYVNDPRNTNDAWMMTTAINLHEWRRNGIFERELKNGFDTNESLIVEITPTLLKTTKIYANHGELIKCAYEHQLKKLQK